MKTILEEVSFRTDENVSVETTGVFSELSDVEDPHLEGWVRDLRGQLCH